MPKRTKVEEEDEDFIPKQELVDTDSDDYYDEAELVEVNSTSSTDKSKRHECDTCLKTFRTAKELRTHIRVHTNERPYKCDHCHKAFKQRGALSDHMNTHTGLNKHECKVCGGHFTTTSSLRRHERQIHAKQKTFTCTLCTAVFQNKAAYFSHKEQHYANLVRGGLRLDADGCYQCTVCGRSFARRQRLLDHLDTHADKTETCEPCGLMFAPLALKRHQAARHSALRCALCGRTHQLREHLARHLRGHFRVAGDVCDYCGRRFADEDRLEGHMRERGCGRAEKRELRLRECGLCAKTYRSVDHLQQHEDFAHVKCAKCSKLFVSYDEMRTHLRTKHRAYKCGRCQMVFRLKSHLAFHLNTAHLIITKFGCGICGSRFPRYKYLRSHLDVHALIKQTGANTLPSPTVWIKQENTETLNPLPEQEASNVTHSTKEIAMSVKDNHTKDVDTEPPENGPQSIKKTKKSHLKKKSAASTDSMQNKQKTDASEAKSKEVSTDGTKSDVDGDLHREVRCLFCPRVTERRLLSRHCSRLHGKHVCAQCLKVFFAVTSLQEHQCEVQEEHCKNCNLCGLYCATRTRLSRHVRDTHMGPVKKQLRYKCTYCRSYMLHKNTLMRHQFTHHFKQLPQSVKDNYAGQMVVCSVCKEPVNLKQLGTHRKAHRQSDVSSEVVDNVTEEQVDSEVVRSSDKYVIQEHTDSEAGDNVIEPQVNQENS